MEKLIYVVACSSRRLVILKSILLSKLLPGLSINDSIR